MFFMQQGVKVAGTLIWYHTHTQTHKHTAHSGAKRLTHPSKYIYTPTVMCSQQLPLLHWLFKNYSFVKVIYLLIRCYKTRFFLWNTTNTGRNGVNKQNTHAHMHTPNTQRKIELGKVC